MKRNKLERDNCTYENVLWELVYVLTCTEFEIICIQYFILISIYSKQNDNWATI